MVVGPAESSAFQINEDLWPEFDGHMPLGEGEIRLIDIQAANPPFCTIRQVVLDDKPHYHGLSYYWGAPVSSENLQAIQLNGSRVLVQPNIFSFISRLAARHNEITVWIDVLCINQRDSEERSQQVSTMGNIFRFAAGVYVWLGEGDADSDYAFDHINHKERQFNTQILSHCFEQLTLRPYWMRLWIVQEIALAKQVCILCGTKSSSWDNFIMSIKLEFTNSSPHFRQVMSVRDATERDRQLYELMQDFKLARCVDARDKAYGFRALAEDGNDLYVDYKEPIEGLFFRIVSLYQETTYLCSENLGDFRRSSEPLLEYLLIPREGLQVALDGSKADRLRYLTEFYGRVDTVEKVEGTLNSDLKGCHTKLGVKVRNLKKLLVLYSHTKVLPGDIIYQLSKDIHTLDSVLVVLRPGSSEITDVAINPRYVAL